jgi:hypothetical protein
LWHAKLISACDKWPLSADYRTSAVTPGPSPIADRFEALQIVDQGATLRVHYCPDIVLHAYWTGAAAKMNRCSVHE